MLTPSRIAVMECSIGAIRLLGSSWIGQNLLFPWDPPNKFGYQAAPPCVTMWTPRFYFCLSFNPKKNTLKYWFQSGRAAPNNCILLASRLHVRRLLESIVRDLCHPDYHDNRGSEAEAHESPVLPPVFHRLATGGCYSGFSGGADENVQERRWHHPGPAREHVRPEFHTGQTIKIIAHIK